MDSSSGVHWSPLHAKAHWSGVDLTPTPLHSIHGLLCLSEAQRRSATRELTVGSNEDGAQDKGDESDEPNVSVVTGRYEPDRHGQEGEVDHDADQEDGGLVRGRHIVVCVVDDVVEIVEL